MTDLPYRRGRSPLQNLILRGHEQTKLTAFQITEEIDAGPVYLKEKLLLHGRAEEILRRIAHVAVGMIKTIIHDKPEPTEQQGKVVEFERRFPEQSKVPHDLEPRELYDFIRILDADEYPRAFLSHGDYRVEFLKPSFHEGELCCETRIRYMEEKD